MFTVAVNSVQLPTPNSPHGSKASLNIEQLRADTRGCTQVAHLNNAGSALPPSVVVDTVIDYLRLEEQIGGYEAHAQSMDQLNAVYESVATLIGAKPENIALTESATSSWDRAFSAIAFADTFTPSSRILVSSSEYASNVLPIMQIARKTGASIEYIPDSDKGVTDLAALRDLLDDSVALVSINHCPSQNGLINDVTGMGEIIRSITPDTWYLVDACQSVGQIPVNATEVGADFLSVTGRKFLRGPRGTGFLYCSQRALTELEPFPLDLHGGSWNGLNSYEIGDGARRFESWEKSYAALIGLGSAIDYALALGMDAIEERITTLASYARSQLSTVSGVQVHDRGDNLSGIVTFTHDTAPANAIVAMLRESGINVSLGTPDYSQVDYLAHNIDSLVRVSPHVYNTNDEIDLLIRAVDALAN